MRRIFFGAIFSIIIGYSFTLWMQTKQVRETCSEIKLGMEMPSTTELDENLWLTVMGPFENTDTKNMHVVLCSTAAMCDTSCNITYKNNIVIEAKYVNY